MAYITVSSARSLLSGLGQSDTRWTDLSTDEQREFTEKASARIELLPFKEDSQFVRPRYVSGKKNGFDDDIPYPLGLCVALLAYHYALNPLDFRRVILNDQPMSTGVADLPLHIQTGLWPFLQLDVKTEYEDIPIGEDGTVEGVDAVPRQTAGSIAYVSEDIPSEQGVVVPGDTPGGLVPTFSGKAYEKVYLIARQEILRLWDGVDSNGYVTSVDDISLTLADSPFPEGPIIYTDDADNPTSHWLGVARIEPPDDVNAIIVDIIDTGGNLVFSSAIPWRNAWGREVYYTADGYLYVRCAGFAGADYVYLAIQKGNYNPPVGLTIQWYFGRLGGGGSASANPFAEGSVNADNVAVDTASFDGNLSAATDTVQKALEALDDTIASGGGTDDQTASEVSVAASGFDGNLSSADDTVQKALQTIDDLTISGGGSGTDDQTASEVPVAASGFDGNLSPLDDTVQKALLTIDNLSITGGGSGTDDQIASEVPVIAQDFDGLLSTLDTNVQSALERLDGVQAGDITLDASGFGGFLETIDTNLQALAAKVNTISASAIGYSTANIDGLLFAQTVTNLQAIVDFIDGLTADEIPVNTAFFDGNLTSAITNVQKLAQAVDDLTGSQGGGTDDQTASEVPVEASGFDGNLSSSDDTVQKALQTLDDLSVVAGGDSPADTRGELIHRQDLFDFATSLTLSATAVSLGFSVGGGKLRRPSVVPRSDVLGLWFVFESNGIEFGTVFVPWFVTPSTTYRTAVSTWYIAIEIRLDPAFQNHVNITYSTDLAESFAPNPITVNVYLGVTGVRDDSRVTDSRGELAATCTFNALTIDDAGSGDVLTLKSIQTEDFGALSGIGALDGVDQGGGLTYSPTTLRLPAKRLFVNQIGWWLVGIDKEPGAVETDEVFLPFGITGVHHVSPGGSNSTYGSIYLGTIAAVANEKYVDFQLRRLFSPTTLPSQSKLLTFHDDGTVISDGDEVRIYVAKVYRGT